MNGIRYAVLRDETFPGHPLLRALDGHLEHSVKSRLRSKNCILGQGSTNYGLVVKSIPLPVSVRFTG